MIVGPKKETPLSRGLLCQVNNGVGPWPDWQYEQRDISMKPSPRLLVRVTVAKIRNRRRLKAVLRDTPLRPEQEGWKCVEWVQEALRALDKDGSALGTSVSEWQTVRDWAMWYIDAKHRAGRFDRYYDPDHAPTWDLLENTETVT